MTSLVCQFAIMLCGASSVWLMSRREHWRRWGYIIGLVAQPFWFIETISKGQYLIALISCWYTYSWAMGVWNYWIKSQEQAPVIEGASSPGRMSGVVSIETGNTDSIGIEKHRTGERPEREPAINGLPDHLYAQYYTRKGE